MFPVREPFVIVDLETTGGSPLGHRVIECGALRVEPDGRTVSYSTLVNPRRRVAPFILALTGIRQDDLEGAPEFADVAARVLELTEGATFVAHNARFDYSFLRHEFARLGLRFQAPTLCSARFSRALYPEYRRHDLSSLVERFSLPMEHRHRALDDARAVYDFFVRALADRGPAAFAAAFERLSAPRASRCALSKEAIDALPDSAGVYVFYDAEGAVLYVGKSRNVRDRVLSHFYSDHENGKTLGIAQKTVRVEARRTSGELSALLLEAELVKKLRPHYNRRLRGRLQYVFAVRRTAASGHHEAALESASSPEEAQGNVLGIFTTVKRAKDALFEAARNWSLCAKRLGLEKGEGPCFSYHLKSCAGACVGEEAPEAYNARFDAAFPPAIRPWPYKGAVLVEERADSEACGEAFVVQDWKVRSKIRFEDGAEEESRVEAAFDYDSYRILESAFRKGRPGLRIRPLPDLRGAREETVCLD